MRVVLRRNPLRNAVAGLRKHRLYSRTICRPRVGRVAVGGGRRRRRTSVPPLSDRPSERGPFLQERFSGPPIRFTGRLDTIKVRRLHSLEHRLRWLVGGRLRVGLVRCFTEAFLFENLNARNLRLAIHLHHAMDAPIGGLMPKLDRDISVGVDEFRHRHVGVCRALPHIGRRVPIDLREIFQFADCPVPAFTVHTPVNAGNFQAQLFGSLLNRIRAMYVNGVHALTSSFWLRWL
ncbi:hypothetical protein MYA_6053 (plasmid) [Burkholderia sp. KJ006]|nr:hypothetical protein MYA_6053 [Burkholderia sp. KJ006]